MAPGVARELIAGLNLCSRYGAAGVEDYGANQTKDNPIVSLELVPDSHGVGKLQLRKREEMR